MRQYYVNKAAIGVIIAVGIGVLVLSVIISNDSPENMELEEITLDESVVFEESILPEEQVNVGKEISVELFEKVGMTSP